MNAALSRRHLFRFLAASPLLAAEDKPIQRPADALNVFDFERVARRNVPAAHFGYMATGVDDERTLRANTEAFARLQLRPRRLIDVSPDFSQTFDPK
jgi:hypothetical protein